MRKLVALRRWAELLNNDQVRLVMLEVCITGNLMDGNKLGLLEI